MDDPTMYGVLLAVPFDHTWAFDSYYNSMDGGLLECKRMYHMPVHGGMHSGLNAMYGVMCGAPCLRLYIAYNAIYYKGCLPL